MILRLEENTPLYAKSGTTLRLVSFNSFSITKSKSMRNSERAFQNYRNLILIPEAKTFSLL